MIYFTGGASAGGSPSEWSSAPSQTFASELHLLLWTRFFAILSATRLLVILQCLLLVSCGHAPPLENMQKKKDDVVKILIQFCKQRVCCWGEVCTLFSILLQY